MNSQTSCTLLLADCLAEERGVPKEQVKTWIPYPGGAPANVAAALGRLGVKVSFVSAVGQDDLGEQMLDLLQSKTSKLFELCQLQNVCLSYCKDCCIIIIIAVRSSKDP